MDDPELLSDYLRADAGINSLRGVGASEAPRGTLFHDYTVDRNGLLQKVNLIVATGQNNLAMNQTVAQIARHYVTGAIEIPEPLLNRVEHGIRCYDPVPELLHPRRRPDADARAAHRAGRHGAERSQARMIWVGLRGRRGPNVGDEQQLVPTGR